MKDTQSSGKTVVIEDVADIRVIPAIHARLLDAFKTSDHIVLDARATGDVDISFLQLIESARRYAVSASKTFSLVAPAQGELHQQLQRGGFLSRTADRAFWLRTGEGA